MAVTYTVAETTFPDTGNSTDYIYDNDSYACSREEDDVQAFGAAFQLVLYSFIFFVGVLGNCLMVAVLLRGGRSLRTTEIYLLHLALADLMLLFTVPFDMANLTLGWRFGDFLCKLTGLLKTLNLLCGSFLLACIGFDRYLAVVHAIPSMRGRRPRTVHLTCAALWLVCLGFSAPSAAFLSASQRADEPQPSCYYYDHGIHGHNWVLTRGVLNHLCFFLPLAIMSYCYAALVAFLCKSQTSAAKQGAIRLSLLVTLVFCLCWLPYNVVLLIKTMADLRVIKHESCRSYNMMDAAVSATRSLGLSHCCLNPFLYAFVGVRFRHELTRLLSAMGCGRFCPSGGGRAFVSEGATTTSSTLI